MDVLPSPDEGTIWGQGNALVAPPSSFEARSLGCLTYSVQGLATGMCPYCGNHLSGLTCTKCGTICQRCGMPSPDGVCSDCNEKSEGWSSADSSPGEEAPQQIEKIVRPASSNFLSRRQRAFLRSTFFVDSSAESTYDRVITACDKLPLSEHMKSRMVARITKRVSRLRDANKMSVEEAIAFLILSEMRMLGFSLQSIQTCLARAGFKIKLESISLVVAVPTRSAPVLRVNGYPRNARVSKTTDRTLLNVLEALNLGSFDMYTLRVQVFLADALDNLKVRFQLLSGYFLDHGRMVQQLDLPISISKCFSLFKTEKLASVDKGRVAPQLNSVAFLRPIIPSNALPISSELMKSAGKLREIEGRIVETFRIFMGDSSGKAPKTLAVRALYDSDRKVFASCDSVEKSKLKLQLQDIVLQDKKDIEYTGIQGFLVPSEVDRVLFKNNNKKKKKEG